MRYLFLSLLLLIGAVALVAQTPDVLEDTQGFLHYKIEAIYGALIILGGYFSRFFPVVGTWNPIFRVLAWAVVSGGLFAVLTPLEATGAAITYAISTSLYEVIFKWIKKTPEPEPAKG